MTEPDTPATPPTPPLYPVSLLLAGRPVLVVGGGRVAIQKISGLRRAEASVTVVAPRIAPELAGDPALTCHHRPYAPGEVAGYRLAIACTDDPQVNARVAADGEAAGVWVNSADDPPNCHFHLPATARRGPVQIAVSTGGASPALASWLRRRIQAALDSNGPALDRFTTLLVETRAALRAATGTSEHPGWVDAVDGDLFDVVATGDLPRAHHQLRTALGLPPPQPPTLALATAPPGPTRPEPVPGCAEPGGHPLLTTMPTTTTPVRP